MATVAEHMSRDLVTVGREEPLVGAAKAMDDRRVGAALVLDGGRLVGILTERDVLRAVAAGAPVDSSVDEWMTGQPESVEPDESLAQAAVLMIHGGFRHLPVLDQGRAIGIVSIRDLVRVTLDDSAPRGA
jgi:CBS domain-containing protein